MVERLGEMIYVHNTKRIWVVNYPEIERTPTSNGHPEHWSVYYAIEKPRKGYLVWAHNNKRLGDYLTLDEAFKAGDAYEEKKAA